MHGFPLVNAGLIVAVMALVLVPLFRLTSSRARPPVAAPVVVPTEDRVGLRVRSAHPPRSLTVTHLGEPLWRADSREAIDEGAELSLAIPAEGIDLLVAVEWAEDTPESALEITLEPEGRERLSRVLWGQGSAEEILTFVWEDRP